MLKAWGVTQLGMPNEWGVLFFNFQGKALTALLEIADLITFPVCKSSSKNQLQKQDKDLSGRC